MCIKKESTAEEINQVLKESSKKKLKEILGYSEEPLV